MASKSNQSTLLANVSEIKRNTEELEKVNKTLGVHYDLVSGNISDISDLQNKDEYDFEVITIPGVTIQNGAIATTTLIDTVTQRGDAIAVVDTRNYGATINQAITSAGTIDSSFVVSLSHNISSLAHVSKTL
mgnify:CR=1 FL=1